MGIYTFTCEACHNQVRVKKEAGQALAEEGEALLCDACRTEAEKDFTLVSDESLDEALGKKRKR